MKSKSQGKQQHAMRAVILLFVTIGLSACLKTRAQLQHEHQDEPDREESVTSAPAPTAVHPEVSGSQENGGYALDELKSEFTRLEGRIDELEHHPHLAGGGAGNQALVDRVHALEQTQVMILETLKTLQHGKGLPESQDLFQKGLSDYNAKNYEAAIVIFDQYLKTSKPKKAEMATLLKGNAHYQQKEYKKAIVEYSKFPEKYTKSAFLPEVLYKIGLSFDSLEMKDDARGFYQEVIEKFPKSPEAIKAKKKIK